MPERGWPRRHPTRIASAWRTSLSGTIARSRSWGSGWTSYGGDSRPGPGAEPARAIIRSVTIRAVFFDAGETIVHPYPSFPDLLTRVLREHGHEVEAEDVRGRLHVISDRFLEASMEGNLW